MFKNKMKLKPLIKNFPVHIELRSLLHDILLKNTHYNYFYFVSGTVTLNSLEELMFKFHNYYNIFDSTNSRNVKYKNNQATVKFTLFYDGGDQLAFLLFARAGINGSRDHLFFDLEKVSDIRNAKTPLTIYGHELKRFNLNVSKYIDNPIIINEPSSIYKEHKNFLIITILTISLLTIIVVVLKANIQRREKLERELSNRIEFDKVLFDTIPNAIYYKNVDGHFLGCNTAFASLVSSTKEEIIGKTAFDFFPTEIATKNTQIDKEVLKTFTTISFEFTFYTLSNEMKHIILNKAAYKNIDGTIGGIVCIMDDMTERTQQRQFLIQQSKLAEMGDMIAAIAHQWNEPLVELSALVQDIETSYLLNELKDNDVKNFVNDSMIQIKYMSKTLSDFRNFLKPSTKKVLFSISKALNEINEIIGKQVFYSNINMNFNYKNKNEELLIYGYENEFKQVLLNIINNAKNKIVEKNLPLNKKGEININIQRCENCNMIEIIDDAGAIDEKIINSIFEPYFTTKENGMGLGLYMAKIIIEDKMKGTISVRNDKNCVIFTIKLPFKKA